MKPFTFSKLYEISWNNTQQMKLHRKGLFLSKLNASLTVLFGFGVEDVAAPLCEVRQHAEHRLNAELWQAGGRLLTSPLSSSITLCQHGQHLLRYLEGGVLSCPNQNFFSKCKWYSSVPHLLLLCRCAAQQHVEQNVRQQVDCDLVVVFDDETTAGEHSAGQLMSHLKHIRAVP